MSKKVKFNKELVKKYMFAVGGDMSETVAVAIDLNGNLIDYKEIKKVGLVHVKTFHILELDEEFTVVDEKNPIPRREYDTFKNLYEDA